MTTYLLENNPETVKWLLSRSNSKGYSAGGSQIIFWANIHHFIVVDPSMIESTDGIMITLKELQELEVLQALGITL